MQTKLELIRGIRHLKPEHAICAAAIGNFDGVHLGHQALIKKLIETGNKNKLVPTIILFEPQPQEFFLKEAAQARLMRLGEKIKAIQLYGVSRILVLSFNASLANLSAQDFVQTILMEKLQVRYLIAGNDFHFGKGRLGTLELVKAHGITVEKVPPVLVEHQKVSSTAIRNALREGNLDQAKKLLGHPFSMSGCIRKGDQKGRLIGFPTANILLHRQNVPILGVYAVRVKNLTANPLLGVANVGVRPTVGGTRILLEVHLFDFNASIYGCYIDVEFIQKLRDEMRFNTFEELKAQILKDALAARKIGERSNK